MPWPTTTSFTDAVQNPRQCFQAPDLRAGALALTPRGTPLIYSGNFACVYRLTTRDRAVAVRCFTREVKDQQQRYNQLSSYLQGVLPDSFVGFEYLERGILVRGQWYPIVRMDWAEGEPLNQFVRQNLGRAETLNRIAARWRAAVSTLRSLGIAHNDLQHGNVMVQNDRLRLVDYDSIFLPDFQNQSSPETGHKNYQHPRRSEQDYHAQIDNFPSLVVYLSLLALVADPDLWERFYNEDNLLLTRQDYATPRESECLQALKESKDAVVRSLAAQLERYCALPVEQVPDLESIITGRTAAAGSAPGSGAAASAIAMPAAAAPAPPAPGAYRDLLQNAPAPPQPQPVAPAAAPVKCPQCGRNNDAGLIYCADDGCQTTLLTTTRICACYASIPANARFCPRCGQQQPGQPGPAPDARTAAPAAPAARKTCPHCRSSVTASAKYCVRCGKAV